MINNLALTTLNRETFIYQFAESCPKATGVRTCIKATEEPRTEVSPKAD